MAGKGRAQGGMSGGSRPGAGGKKPKTVAEQVVRRTVALEVFSPDEWRETLIGWRDTARATGNYGMLFPLLPYLMGAAKLEIEHSGQIDHVKISEIRQAIGVTDIRALNAPKRETG